MTAHGGMGSIGIYNNAAELHTYENIWCRADNGLVINGYNDFSVVSPYQTIDTTIVSMSQVNITGYSTISSYDTGDTRYPIYVANARGIYFQNTYVAGNGYAGFWVDGVKRFQFNGHFEGPDRVADIRGSSELEFEFTGGLNTGVSPFYLGASPTVLANISIKADNWEPTWPYLIEGVFNANIRGAQIMIGDDDGTADLTNIIDANATSIFRTAYRRKIIDHGSTEYPSLSFDGDYTTGWYRVGVNQWGLSINDALKYRFNEFYFDLPTALRVDGTKVVGAQGAAVSDATGGATIDSEARTAINLLLARLRAHGLIDT